MTDAPADGNEKRRRRMGDEIGEAAISGLRNLYLLHGDEAIGLIAQAREAAAVQRPQEPVVIAIESFGATELATLREYVELYVEDWEIGLEEGRSLLAALPEQVIDNASEATRRPGSLRLLRVLDRGLLEAELGRLENEYSDL
jgi:hypothetical protein